MSPEGSPPGSKNPASGETSGSRKPKSATARESTYAKVLERAFNRLSPVEEILWEKIAGVSDDISSIQVWLNVAYELRVVAGHRANLKPREGVKMMTLKYRGRLIEVYRSEDDCGPYWNGRLDSVPVVIYAASAAIAMATVKLTVDSQ
jgi:hypothetical protein